MVDPGTILAVVQLSTSVLKLGRDIVFEFFGPERAPEKLKHLNTRLQILNDFLGKVIEQPGSPDKLSTTRFPGSISIEKTLRECKAFLEQYKSLLSGTASFNTTARRVQLVVGPDASRLDEFHRRIDQHYTELEQWRIGSLTDRVDELRILITSVRDSISGTSTNPPPSYSGHATPELSPPPDPNISLTIPTDSHANQQLLLASSHISPVLRANPRNPSLTSIPELPPPAFPITESGPAIGTAARLVDDYNTGLDRASLPLLHVPSSGQSVTLVLGNREEIRFSHDGYQVHEEEAVRIIEWTSSQTRIRHFLPLDLIPYTKPADPKLEVTFLPRRSKHKFIVHSTDGPKSIHDEVSYRFTARVDRERFQRQVRGRPFLQMIRVVRIHTAAEKNVAMDVHLKVWARNEQDTEPTISFAYLGENKPKHHVEYVIRWFKREPERNGKNRPRLVLRPYTEDTDLSYLPLADDTGKKNSTLRDCRRRISLGSNISFGSSTPCVSNFSEVLYECKGKTAPSRVRELGYLEIEFDNVALREKFVNACFEAHPPVPRTPRRATLGSDIDSFTTNQTPVFSARSPTVSQVTTPQRSVAELDAAACPVELPSPAIPRHVPIHFDNLNPFTMPDSIVPISQEPEASDPSPTETQGFPNS